MKLLAPSILSADFSCLLDDIDKAAAGGADMLHIDVMDGHFVPNISFGSVVTKCLKGKTDLPFDVHLMIEEPDRYMEDFVTDQTEYITVHIETCGDIRGTVDHIHSLGIKAGVSLNPETPLDEITDVLPITDMVLVMSVHPGFGGQSFIAETIDKVVEIDRIRREQGLDLLIEIDGGITTENVSEVIGSGVDIAVAGSAVFKADDITERVKEFKEIMG